MNSSFYELLTQKTIPEGQDWFIKKLATFIKSKSKREDIEDGLCYGIAMMWIQALLVGDLRSFNRRLSMLAKFESPEQLQSVVKKINARKIKGEKISADEELVLSIPIFLTGILFHAKLAEFAEYLAELFPDIHNFPSQFGKMSFEYTQPVELKGGVYFANLEPSSSSLSSFSGVYTREEIIMYFSSLTKILSEPPPVTYSLGIELGTPGHSIAVGYDHKTKQWIVTDANELPPKPVKSFEELANLVLSAETFKPYKEKTCFASAMYVEGTNQRDFDSRLQKWVSTPEWKKMHEITDKKAVFYNKREDASFIQTAIRTRDEKLVLKLLKKAEEQGQLEKFVEQGLLVEAVDQGLTTVVKYLLDKKVARNVPNKKGVTPLQMALIRKEPKIVKLLLEHHCDPQTQGKLLASLDGRRNTLLHEAASSSFEEGVKMMLAYGLRVDAVNESKQTPFHVAAEKGAVGAMNVLFKKDPHQLNVSNNFGETPIYAAAEGGYVAALEFLIGKRADANKADRLGNTPLHAAAKQGSVLAVKRLVKYGAKLDAQNADDETALHVAAKYGHVDVVQYLIEKKASRNIVNENGETALDLAVKKGRLRVVKYLIEKGVKSGLANKKGESLLLHVAAKQGHVNTLKYLRRHGVDQLVKDEKGNTPFHVAVRKKRLKVVKYFIEKGEMSSRPNDRGDSPLHLAAKNGDVEMMRLLLDNGAPSNPTNKHGDTPLHVAASQGHQACVELLVSRGVVIVANKAKQLPSEVARDNQHGALADYLAAREVRPGYKRRVQPSGVKTESAQTKAKLPVLSDQTMGIVLQLSQDLSEKVSYQEKGA